MATRISTALIGSPRRAAITAVVVVVVLASLYWLFPPLGQLGGLVALPGAAAVFLVSKYPNEVKQLAGRFLAYLAWTNQSVERESIRQDIEGTVSAGVNELVRACPTAAIGRVRINFVRSAEEAQQLPDGTLVIGIAPHADRTRNLVAAAWAYARHGVLPLARRHLDPDVSRGIDFTVAKSLLSKRDARAVNEFITGTWQPEIKSEDRLRQLTAKLDYLEQDRLFGPVLLEEFSRLGARLINDLPTDAVASETAAFVDHLYCVAIQQYEHTDFDGTWIHCGLVLTATSDVLSARGTAAYIDAVKHKIARAYPRVYLIAWAHHTDVAHEVLATIGRDPRVLGVQVFEEQVNQGGIIRPRLVAQVTVDVREYVGIGQRPIVTVGGAYEQSILRERRDAVASRTRGRSGRRRR